MYSLLYPRLAAELVEGFLQHYREAGWIPRWSSPGFADCMVGTSSDIAFAAALVKDVEVDAESAYLAAVCNAMVASEDTRVGRTSLDSAIFLGWTPVEEAEGLSWSIDGSSTTSASHRWPAGWSTMIVCPTATTVRG